MNGLRSLQFERLELMEDSEGRGAAVNMALDEVLLDRLGGNALLRIYRWRHPSISVGCFEPLAPVARRWPDHDRVRRWTGGGIVEHGRDLTFSLLVPRPMTLTTMPIAESYRVIHAAVAVARARARLPLAPLQADSATLPTASRAGFGKPVRYDLLLSGQKIAGGAQRRTRRGLLHQGSIQAGRELRGMAGKTEWLATLAKELPRAFSTQLKLRTISAAEVEAACSLASAKYANPIWLNRC